MTCLRLILGDQLSDQISSLIGCDKANDLILMCEVWEEATYVKHHKKKIALIFSAMRHFAKHLAEAGYRVRYIKLDDPGNMGSFFGEVKRCLSEEANGGFDTITVSEPGEYRVLKDMETWSARLGLPVNILPDKRFLCSRDEFASWAKERSSLRMEYFYRDMRKRYSVLMDGDKPLGDKWNFDSENRKPASDGLQIPAPYMAENDEITAEVLKLVECRFGNHFGDLKPFHFAVTREQALEALASFIEFRLARFGDYQDAMIKGEPWMFHAHLSFYLNLGLLDPLECLEAAETAYHAGHAPLNAVEGFIRQTLGWREFVRGIYWLKMPGYKTLNALNAKRDLPDFYWDGASQMNCLRQCVLETRTNAYAHHIQRLMVLGNFALLAGVDPDQVNEWFLVVYADAFEWVELPNVTGMILFADGGYLASKPYAAGGAYISRMSDYCKTCRYKVTKKNGPDACPFNYLYWDFLDRNRETLSGNHRLAMAYRTYSRMGEDKKAAISEDSRRFLAELSSP